MANQNNLSYIQAIADFENAHRRVGLEEVLGKLTHKSVELVSFDEIRKRLWRQQPSPPRLEEIPLDAIVGSVSRYNDFTRTFLPKKANDRDRWAKVWAAQDSMEGVPPIEVYQIGDVYFVLDGHHRISVVHQMGGSHIQAYVTTIQASAPLKPEDSPDELILKTETSAFLEQFRTDELLPGVDLHVSAPGKYLSLMEHISVHQYFMGIDFRRPISQDEAVRHWYENVYLPVVGVIRKRGLLREFPGRTEVDLYLWLAEYRSILADELGWDVTTEAAAKDLSRNYSSSLLRVLVDQWKKFLRWLTPDVLEWGLPPGEWRREHSTLESPESIFQRILVAVPGSLSGWNIMDVALNIAQREGSWLGGLYVAPNTPEEDSSAVENLRVEFENRCRSYNVQGRLAVEKGPVAPTIVQRSAWADMVVVQLNYPPPPRFLGRLFSGMRLLIQQCPSPILVVPSGNHRLKRALLAYDDSPKSREAMYVSAYLAGRWGFPLIVLTTMPNPDEAARCCQAAREYLEGLGIVAEYIHQKGDPAAEVLKVAAERDIDFVVMGGYSAGPIRGLFTGSTVDRVLQSAPMPVLICH
jgi:nucleotide-binding universal stress UspA family protein